MDEEFEDEYQFDTDDPDDVQYEWLREDADRKARLMANRIVEALGIENDWKDEIVYHITDRLYHINMGFSPRPESQGLGAIDTLNLIDDLHPTKNSREQYAEAVKEIKELAIHAIKEGRL